MTNTKNTNPKEAAGDTRIPLWLLSPLAKAKWAVAQFAGFLKYGGHNWRAAGVRHSTYISAAERHIDGIKAGEDFDPIDGTDHWANLMACGAIVIDARSMGKLNDDRGPAVDIRPGYAECEANMAALRVLYHDKDPRDFTIADTEECFGVRKEQENPNRANYVLGTYDNGVRSFHVYKQNVLIGTCTPGRPFEPIAPGEPWAIKDEPPLRPTPLSTRDVFMGQKVLFRRDNALRGGIVLNYLVQRDAGYGKQDYVYVMTPSGSNFQIPIKEINHYTLKNDPETPPSVV